MKGYRLLLGKRKFSFPRGNRYSRRNRLFRFYHSYCPENATFTEGQEPISPGICDGGGFSCWKLDFLTPLSGLATLIDQDALGHYAKGEMLPFSLES